MPDALIVSLAWFRLYGETVDDAKLKLLAFEDRWHYIAILCCKAQGILDNTKAPLLDRTLSVKLGLGIAELGEVKRRLIEVDLIGSDWQPAGWERRQYASDDVNNRVRRFRERQRSLPPPQTPPEEQITEADTDTERVVTGNVTVTFHETLPETEWGEWIDLRKRRRWPCDPTTLRKQLGLLARYDTATQREILDASMNAGWQGLFPPKSNGKQPPTKREREPTPAEIAEARRKAIEDNAAALQRLGLAGALKGMP